jgi:ADP-ribose pyrophosphatase YjhB (NUDIX family)
VPDPTPPQRQRVAAYALIRRGTDELLLTRLAPQVAFKGWTLPGGGVDHGEHPREALRREVLEESGLHAEPGRILDVYSHHYTGPRPDGLVEDYHAIGLVFEAALQPQSYDVEPYVLDVGGSTDRARWTSVEEARTLALTGSARLALTWLETDGRP